MKKPLRIYARASLTDVSYATGNILLAIKNAAITTDPYLLVVVDKLTGKNNLLTIVINENKQVSVLSEKDNNRDNCTRVVFLITKALLYSTDDAERKDAEVINAILQRYGLDIINKTYSEQTVVLNALLSDLEQQDIAAITVKYPLLQKHIDRLKASQTDWMNSVQTHVLQQNEQKNTPSASKLHPEIREIVNNELMVYIDAMKKANPDTYGELATQIENIIIETNQRIRNRNSAEATQEVEEPTDVTIS